MPSLKVTHAIRAQLKKAKAKIEELQERYPMPSDTWHALETIDDCLHEISASIGD